ncbi:ribose 5-phosphate isomerase B [Shouchella clausii]|uniref:Ribose 5-phosphate isomerase B n=5 Tax=Shouchella TaxID=2893057 RepID=Q5WBW6_SHOC1|nr:MULTISPECIES: ribose 5-phosphate isomerase B [Shouchella]MCM3310950.1 ribose 5-phosphate isomerase B [Psychrobacillus sp. MER TA 17]PAD42625.1 ribose 5-phosphate isomerase B [Bacillus sp. 7520-S]ALA53439.1 Ribose 5-phosphate isomerase B [Shouchella clausii]AST96140.1 ribose 5-phosphate isomerase B [Shouchella clausii]KKI86072.1 sugar phosphate isomerase [Shouchella clausii]
MKIAIGSDHNAFELKEELKTYMIDEGYDVVDYGCHSCEAVDYPDVSFRVGNDIMKGEIDRGILICGTGIGVAIAAGKVPGIRAALCHDTYSAERAQLSNNAQILTMGAKVIGPEAAKKVLNAYLGASFAGGPSARKIQQIAEQEQAYLEQESR